MDLLRSKINKAMKEEFVGNFIFTKEELTFIYDEAGHVLRKICNERGGELSHADYELIFIALVNLSKEWDVDEESALFKFYYKKLLGGQENSTTKIYNQIIKVVDDLNKSKRIFVLDYYKKKYYATLCSHSFAPVSSIESFFDMCWDVYCKDLAQQYRKNDSVFSLITKSLQNKFSSSLNSNDEDFEIGSKVYSFRAGVRGLAIDEPKLMTYLLDKTMESIHSLFSNEPLSLNKYINVLINNWWKKKEQTFGIEKHTRTNMKHEYIITDYSQINAKYILENGVAKLFISPIRLLDNFNYEPYIKIKSCGEIVKHEKMITSGSGILMSTKAYECELSELLFDKDIDISIEITHCNQIIYDSKDSLGREFILFNDSKEMLSQDCLPGIYFLYVCDFESLARYPNDIHASPLKNTYSIEAVEGDVLQCNEKTVFFIGEKSNRDFYFFVKERNDVLFRSKGEEYKVVDGELCVDAALNIDIRNYGVRYEGSLFKLSDFNYTIINDRRRFQISILLNVGEPQHISIFKYSDNSICERINLIKFNNIKVIFDKALYFDEECIGTVKFITEKYNEENQFNINDSEVTIPISNGKLVLFPPVLKWRIDNGEWKLNKCAHQIWYKNFTNSSILSIELPKTMTCNAILNNNDTIEQRGNKLDFKLGQTIYSLKENIKDASNSFSLCIRTNTDQLYFLAEIFYRETFIDEPIYVFSNFYQIYWNPENYIGDRDSIFKFEIFNDNVVIYSKELTTRKETIKIFNISEGYYKYRVILKNKGFLSKQKELYSKEFVFGDEKKLKYKDKILFIQEVMLFDSVNAEKMRPIYIDTINFIGSKDGYDYYSGLLFVINKDGKKIYLNSMKDENDSFIKVNPLRIEFMNEKFACIMYGLDTSNDEITVYDGFYLDGMGKTTICERAFGKKTKGIDYFIFEVRKNV